jgi:hypothetical protein
VAELAEPLRRGLIAQPLTADFVESTFQVFAKNVVISDVDRVHPRHHLGGRQL